MFIKWHASYKSSWDALCSTLAIAHEVPLNYHFQQTWTEDLVHLWDSTLAFPEWCSLFLSRSEIQLSSLQTTLKLTSNPDSFFHISSSLLVTQVVSMSNCFPHSRTLFQRTRMKDMCPKFPSGFLKLHLDALAQMLFFFFIVISLKGLPRIQHCLYVDGKKYPYFTMPTKAAKSSFL